MDDASAAIYERIARLQETNIEALGVVVGELSAKARDELEQHIDERLKKLRAGPSGARGATGAKGDSGARGPQGAVGPVGKPGPTIAKWILDKKRYSALPVMSDGTVGPELQLHGLFEQFQQDTR